MVKPGYWIEFYEMDIQTLRAGPLYTRLTDAFTEELKELGLNARIASRFKHLLEDEPLFTEVTEEIRYPGIGEWNGKIGGIMIDNMAQFYMKLFPRLIKQLGIRTEEVEDLWKEIKQEFKEYQTCLQYHRIYAKKTII